MSNQLIIFSLINKKQFNKSQKIHKESFGWTQRFSLWLLVIFSFLRRDRTMNRKCDFANDRLFFTVWTIQTVQRPWLFTVPERSPTPNVPEGPTFLTFYKFFYPEKSHKRSWKRSWTFNKNLTVRSRYVHALKTKETTAFIRFVFIIFLDVDNLNIPQCLKHF